MFNKKLMMCRLKEQAWASPLPRVKLQNLFNSSPIFSFQIANAADEPWSSGVMKVIRKSKTPQRRRIGAITNSCLLYFMMTARIRQGPPEDSLQFWWEMFRLIRPLCVRSDRWSGKSERSGGTWLWLGALTARERPAVRLHAHCDSLSWEQQARTTQRSKNKKKH